VIGGFGGGRLGAGSRGDRGLEGGSGGQLGGGLRVFGNGIRFVWHTDFSQEKQVPEGALVHAVEAGFIAVDEADGLGGGEILKGGGEAADFIGAGLVIHVVLEHAGFDGPGAAHAPVGTYHLLDEADLDAVGGLEALRVKVDEGVEAFAFLGLEDDALGE